MAFNQNKYNNNFAKHNYDNLKLILPKGKKEELKDYAKCNDISLAGLIKKAITKYSGIEF